jgi:hypothetical protein
LYIEQKKQGTPDKKQPSDMATLLYTVYLTISLNLPQKFDIRLQLRPTPAAIDIKQDNRPEDKQHAAGK